MGVTWTNSQCIKWTLPSTGISDYDIDTEGLPKSCTGKVVCVTCFGVRLLGLDDGNKANRVAWAGTEPSCNSMKTILKLTHAVYNSS